MTESPRVRVSRATAADTAVVAEMMQAYLRAMAPFTDAEPDSDGQYRYHYFDAYWSPHGEAEGRIPYLITANEAVAGFAFVNRYSRLRRPDTWNIAEFYVKERWRRSGVGRKTARHLFTIHPGRWEIAVLRTNAPAFAFWTSVVKDTTNDRFEIARTDPEIWDGSVLTLRAGSS